jgi:hypothetical protein
MSSLRDPIVEEVRKYRNQHASEHGHDLRRIFADLRKKEACSGRRVVTRPPRVRLKYTGT